MQQSLAHSSGIRLIWQCLLVKSYMYERCSMQLEQPEYSNVKTNQNTAGRLCDKEENYTFTMCITRNEKYLHWEHESFEHVGLPKLHRWQEHYSNWLLLSLSLPEWPVIIPDWTRMVNLSTFGSRFGTVRLWPQEYYVNNNPSLLVIE